MTEVSRSESRDLFGHCPGGCVCGVRELVAKQAEQGERDANEVDAAEMRSLLVAVRDGYETIRTDPRLVERRHAATTAYERAERHLNRMRTSLAEQRVAGSAAEVARTERAASGGRRRPSWLRRVRWPVVIGIGLFDAWYFSQVFRYLTSQTGDGGAGGAQRVFTTVETVVAIVPGLVLAVVIATGADLLMRSLKTWKEAAFHQREKIEGRGRVRAALGAVGHGLIRLAWWLLPVVFVMFLLAVIAVWAGIRAKSSAPPDDGYPMSPVMALILLLSVGAMAVKIAADDRPADDVSAARRRLRRQQYGYKLQSGRADRLIGAYDSAWRDLRMLRDDLVGLLRIKMLSAWEGFILRVRSLHRMVGNVTAAPWPTGEAPSVRQEFEGIPQPAMELGPLLEICRLIDERDPERLREIKRDLDAEYARQVNIPQLSTREAAPPAEAA
ncbi:hypothetical protein [Mangrovihabitans endophyticus]|uniref:Uncharacterized protein n=1 Tax=Mangrovihabitans endophyticus TaxID=1751298 RepID=A0A8J3BXR4_9ACTN|nr:hypothetical protein [Mangrovihabitans endophyticus]GGK79227.1 hypothetical protein GCM10012284_11550 [Mangrovihabitans endophyticus]